MKGYGQKNNKKRNEYRIQCKAKWIQILLIDLINLEPIVLQIKSIMGAFLDQPITEKKIEVYQHKKLRACTVEMQGWRKHMEDAILYDRLDKQIFLFGVFDGHGGAEVAQFCSNHFAITMQQNKFYKSGEYGKALTSVFMELDEMLDTAEGQKQLRQLTLDNGMQPFSDGKVADSVGCTANVVMIIGNKIVVANAGDSRSALSRNGQIIQLSKDHKPQDPKQTQRIEASGAKIEKGRINNHLNLSRCIGDLHYKRNLSLPKNRQTVISQPDITQFDLCKDDEFIIIGCDGVWQRHQTNGQELISRIRKQRISENKSPEIVLSSLLDSFLAKDPKKQQLGCDNMSCVLIEFNKLML